MQRLVIVLALVLAAGLLAFAPQGRAAAPAMGHVGMHAAPETASPVAAESHRHAATAQDCCLIACPVTALEHAAPLLRGTVAVTACAYAPVHESAVSRVAPPRERPPRLHG